MPAMLVWQPVVAVRNSPRPASPKSCHLRVDFMVRSSFDKALSEGFFMSERENRAN
jgi:hypothetical protein